MYRAVLSLVVFLLFASGVGAYESPGVPDGYVNDFAEVLSEAEEVSLAERVNSIEKETGVEVALVTVPTLGGESVERYAVSLFEEWGIGKESVDNGLLILVAPNEKTVRIEVGYGLEGVVTDGAARDIIDRELVPAFANQLYFTGLSAGVDEVEMLLSGELPPPKDHAEYYWKSGLVFAFLVVIALIMGKFICTFIGGVSAAGMGYWWFEKTQDLPTSLMAAAVVGLVVFVLACALFGGSSGGGSGGGWYGGGRSGYSSSRSSTPRFGGGRSGGGGATGRW
jgi:uncharacterized protein